MKISQIEDSSHLPASGPDGGAFTAAEGAPPGGGALYIKYRLMM